MINSVIPSNNLQQSNSSSSASQSANRPTSSRTSDLIQRVESQGSPSGIARAEAEVSSETQLTPEEQKAQNRGELIRILEEWHASASSEKIRDAKAEILSAFDFDHKELTIANLELDTLPDIFHLLPNLQTLDCSDNQLQSLPESLGNAPNLQGLYCFSNQLQSLPESLGNASNIQTLNCSYNQLQSLPESLGNAPNLQTFNCSYNQLQSLPESLGNASNLQTFDCSENQLQSLPESLGNAPNLQTLDCSYNQLQSLPESLGNAANFQELYCSHNQLQSLPESLRESPNLQKLYCFSNQLQSLPESLGNASNIQTLNCSYNQLQSLPNTIYSLSRQTIVDVEYNRFSPEETQHIIAEASATRNATESNNGPIIRINVYESPIAESTLEVTQIPELINFWLDTPSQSPLWQELANQNPDSTNKYYNFAKFLARLQNERMMSAEGETDPDMRHNMQLIIREMENEYGKYEQDLSKCIFISSCITQATDSVDTCVDRVLTGYINIYLSARIQEAEDKRNEDSKVKYIKAVEIINSISNQIALKRQEHNLRRSIAIGDEIEDFLAILIRIEEKYSDALPIKIHSMRYPRCVSLSPDEQDEIIQEAFQIIE